MSRFPLAGLLRLRQLQQDVAAADLARAAARSRADHEAAEAARRHARQAPVPGPGAAGGRTALETGTGALTPQQLGALAATSLGRAAHASELDATARAGAARVTATTAAWARARADLEAVGRLRDRHADTERAARAAAEQRELDDRVAAGWARRQVPAVGGATTSSTPAGGDR